MRQNKGFRASHHEFDAKEPIYEPNSDLGSTFSGESSHTINPMSNTLHAQVVDALGKKIVSGALPAGSVVRAESLEEEFQVSRSVVREAIRSLQLLGMTESVKSLGVRVRDRSSWNPYAREIIRWRILSGDLGAQLRSITELRMAIEPAAAALCAENATGEIGARLMYLASQMRMIGREGDLVEFERLDIEFHATLLAGSGNEMFAHLASPIGAVLHGRTEQGLMPSQPHEEALQWHVDVADAIQARRPEKAREAMDRIVQRTVAEIKSIWQESERIIPTVAEVQDQLTRFEY